MTGSIRAVLLALVALNVALAYIAFFGGKTRVFATGGEDFELLDLYISKMEAEKFHEMQEQMSVTYRPLRDELNNTIAAKKGEYGIYFEDLTTGVWVGINEKKEFVPASLFKMPIVIAMAKKIENGELRLNDKITLTESDIERNFVSGSLSSFGTGYSLTVSDALEYVIEESDNTALNALARQLNYGELIEAYVATGLPLPKFTERIDDNLVSPKRYMGIFRSLYFSTYLRRTYSQLVLSMLVEADFDSALPSGVPDGVKIANKVGFFNAEGGNFHDCGIVYAPKKPYMLCIMSIGTTQASFNAVASNISRTVYEFVVK